ncbi:MAG: DNA recombination protein RmuC [bacterium]|nr:DNA recombination protein RmuC [bacterium]
MQPLTVILLVVLAVAAGSLASYFLSRRKPAVDAAQELKDLLQRMEGFKDALGSRFSQEVNAIRQEMATHLGSNREALERSGQAVHKQMLEFTAGITQMSGALQEVRGSMKEISSFQDILKTPKLRGQWGEAALKHLLDEVFPKESFEEQHYFKSGEAVDAVIKTPDGKLLPIDSKFPLENFQRYMRAETEAEKAASKKLFLEDAKREIDSVSAKYVLPAEGTTDFALLFIPAESVYYEIVNNFKDVDMSEYARKKKILLVSPNTFYLTLQILSRWWKDVRVSRQTQEIQKRLARVLQDAAKLEEDFRKLGGHLTNARGAYETTEKRLSLMVDRTQRIVEGEEKEGLLEGTGKAPE